MFGFDYGELAVVAVVALLVVGPKDLPKLMRTVGHWVGRARGMARHVRSGFDTMVREAEIDEMNKRWEAENEAIMRATRIEPPADTAPPAADPVTDAEAPPASARP